MFEKVKLYVKNRLNTKRDETVAVIILIFIGISWLIGLAAQIINVLIRGLKFMFNPISCIYYSLKFAPTLYLLCLAAAYGLVLFYSVRNYKKETSLFQDYERSDTNTQGSMDFATPLQIRERFEVGNIEDSTGIIVGKDVVTGDVIAQRPKFLGTNNHMVLLGKSGIGKTFTFLKLAIYQCIKAGSSLFITDPSGEIYETTAEVARKHGYKVYIFDIRKSSEFINSDSFNPISDIDGDGLKAQNVAKTIVANASAEWDVWAQFATSLLTFMILYVDQEARKDPNSTRDEILRECNLGRIKRTLENGVDAILSIINSLSPDHPGYGYARDYASADGKTQIPALKNLNDALTMFNNKHVCEMTTYDDINIQLFGHEKCICYLVISSTIRTYDFLSAVFYTEAFSRLQDEAELTADRTLERNVKFILEEFPSTGFIPNYDGIVSNFRKYNVDIIMCLQNIGQLKLRGYEQNILDAFDLALLLGTNDIETAQYFSDRMGDTTAKTTAESENQNRIIKYTHLSITESTREVARNLFPPAEIMNLLNEGDGALKEIAIAYRLKPFVAYTIPSTDHPYNEEVSEIKVYNHIPEFRLRYPEEFAADFDTELFEAERAKYMARKASEAKEEAVNAQETHQNVDTPKECENASEITTEAQKAVKDEYNAPQTEQARSNGAETEEKGTEGSDKKKEEDEKSSSSVKDTKKKKPTYNVYEW